MKKIVLSLAGVLAATAFAPEASALPAFARQTGMACSACHQQHFPILNGFGRAFKAAGYTMMGAQGKVEGEHLSIPDTLNAAILAKVRYVKRSGVASGTGNGLGQTVGGGQWQFGDEFSLFFGGRVAENIGFLLEGNLANHTAGVDTVTAGTPTNNVIAGTGGMLAGFKLPVIFDVGSAKVGAVPFTTDTLGASYGFELSSTGVLRANRWAEQRRDISAVQYAAADGLGGNYTGAATGVALIAQNDFGYINFTRWTPNFAPGANGQAVPSYDMKSNYLRIAATPTLGDWATHIGAGFISGSSEAGPTGDGGAAAGPALLGLGVANGAVYQTKATFADLQAHGSVGGKDLGVYATWAKSPASGATCVVGTATNNQCNLYNSSTTVAKSAWTLGAEYSVIPNALHIGAAYRSGTRPLAGVASKDNSFMVSVVYDLAQNVALHLNQSARSGSFYNVAAPVGKSETLMMLEAAW
ncbi:hypothetical protein FGKAn22_04210 [Ferrigenium kumadai]|uniref:Uncharacterized protein n=1 Tax=Ferrigenium kumadai TaxID=1682490 RepID=A0AAN1SXJ2_9PROT|nr:hypothetical protein [Ferrigenium kumadai]BBI98728.1 hypothetical protein FGKAn22_04210 [Ferrigenium kumadai]